MRMTKTNLLFLLSFIAGLLFADVAFAQSVTIDLGDSGVPEAAGESVAGRIVQIVALLTVLSLAPGILMMMTSFTRIIVVLSFLRTAMGTQQTPPNTVLISLALFMTFFIMAPVFSKAYNDGIQPLVNGEITEVQAFERTVEPFHDFMIANVREKDLELFIRISGEQENIESADDVPIHVLIPAFMITELRRAFEIGFMLFLPFLVIDLVTAAILMSMGMMMLPPVLIALPFKIIFFVLVDGWYLVVGSLMESFTQI